MWKPLEKKMFLRLPESMGMDYVCEKEMENFLTDRETSISECNVSQGWSWLLDAINGTYR
jgi:hypothetical protein